jgi:GNAT superfamily N-acetyltransferase
VVGQRVIVRRVLHGEIGPTGGPAFTDVLGVCLSWADGIAVVMREDGSRISIATRDFVAGKPVPPRPKVRQRASAREAESHAAAFWPRVERLPLGEWELRSDPAPVGRPRKRANSCLAIGDPGAPLDDAVARVVAFYAERNRPPLMQVEADSEVEHALRASGWSPVSGDAALLLGSISRAHRLIGRGTRNTSVEILLEEEGPRAECRCVIDEGSSGGAPIGFASGAYDGDWLGIHSLEVDEEHRRAGVATALVDRLLEFGAENGCLTVWLHVELDNRAAMNMYEQLGLDVHHTCRYLAPTNS